MQATQLNQTHTQKTAFSMPRSAIMLCYAVMATNTRIHCNIQFSFIFFYLEYVYDFSVMWATLYLNFLFFPMRARDSSEESILLVIFFGIASKWKTHLCETVVGLFHREIFLLSFGKNAIFYLPQNGHSLTQ